MYKKNIAFVICILLAIIFIAQTIEHPLRPINTDTTVNSVRSFREFKEEPLEVIVYGSSHAWCGINTEILTEEYGILSYNYGCAWQHVNTTKLFLEDSLREHTPQVVILETDMLTEPLADTEMCGEIYYTKGVGSVCQKWNYLRQCFGNKLSQYIGYLLPTIVFHENWKELTKESFVENANDNDFVKSRGYLGSSSVEPVIIGACESLSQTAIPEDTKKILDEMVTICQKDNIQVVLCTMPFEGDYCYGQAVQEYAKENGLCYINFYEKMQELGIDCETDFRNAEHLNDSGAEKITKYLAEYLCYKVGKGAK